MMLLSLNAKKLFVKPRFAGAHNDLGVALLNTAHHDIAVAEYRIAIRLNPNDAGAHSNLGNALADGGDYDGDIAEQKQAIRLKPNVAEVHDNLGIALAGKCEYDDGRVASGIAPRGSHGSGRADFPHPALRLTALLRDGGGTEARSR